MKRKSAGEEFDEREDSQRIRRIVARDAEEKLRHAAAKFADLHARVVRGEGCARAIRSAAGMAASLSEFRGASTMRAVLTSDMRGQQLDERAEERMTRELEQALDIVTSTCERRPSLLARLKQKIKR